jgi:hypothetical protein
MGMRLILAVMGLLSLTQGLAAQATPEAVDLIRLAEAFRLANAIEATVWPGWETAPFPLLLVGTQREFLIGHSAVPSGFTSDGYSAILQMGIWSRPRQLDPSLLATFPAFGPPAVIVIGRAEVTKKTSAAWVLTVLHEHFHQFQVADAKYYSEVEQLGLAGGDQTGMWMLNYPFPYQSPNVSEAFAAISRELAELLPASSRPDREQFWQRYNKFLDRLSEPDRRYLSFQVWQEGVARYVELRVAEAAANTYRTSLEFRNLPDVQPFSAVAERMRADILRELESPDLRKQQRVSFYAFGAGLALLLDQDGDSWKRRYMTQKFVLERYAR